MKRSTTALTFLAAMSITSFGFAAEIAAPPPSPTYPKVGGHFNLAIPIVTFADTTTAIGADYTKIGLAPGVTVHLDDRWAIDFEFVAYSNFWGPTTISSVVVDPGVIYKADIASFGLRTAVHVAQTQNWGFIPIVVKTIPIGKGVVSALFELDLPLFFNEQGASLTIQPQIGVAF